MPNDPRRLLFVVSEDWYFVSHRLHLAKAASLAGYRVALLTRLSCHRRLIESAGVEVVDWRLNRRSRNPFAELRSLWSLWLAIRYFKPDIVHAVALKPVLYSGVACRLAKVRVKVFALAGLGFVFTSTRFLARSLRPILLLAFRWIFHDKRVRLILQNPDDVRVVISANVIDEGKIRMVRGSGVDTRVFVPTPEPEGTPLVILPARMLWDKGVAEFVALARTLRSKGVEARFALVGEPDEHNPECIPESQLDAWSREGVVEVWGRRTNMPYVYAMAAIVCLPSYREGLPKALLEAASCGRPIVAFDVPGCREVVENGKTGLLAPFMDVSGLAEAVSFLLANRELRTQMGQNGRRLMLENFSQERVAEETLDIWRETTG